MKTINFLQSNNDFPLTVALGKKAPSWGLSRWAGNGGLRFVPPDDEGFSMRGDRQRLVYKGRRRSHRFTILGDRAFEYDCILLREPESNVISLRMEGAERFDFFRQPDFVPDPFLKGSYAVYLKETLIGQGTGKLCHIHRPEIIDARGRCCWGELSVVGNELHITIPEWWLSEAAYPVIVDPTVGTTTVGSQWQYYNDDYDPHNPDDGPEYLQVRTEGSVDVSKFTVPEVINGSCTAYFYVMKDRTYDETDCGGRAVFYSDQSNKPYARKSQQENFINFYAKTIGNEGWRSGSFASNEVIPAGSNIWFGCFADNLWFFRFDYGSLLFSNDWYTVGNTIPDLFNLRYPYQQNYKVSMYFTYSSAQNYVLTLTQGVNLSDNRKLTADYKRSTVETVNGSTIFNPSVAFFRQCLMNVTSTMNLERLPVFVRNTFEQIGITDGLNNNRGLSRKCEDTAELATTLNRQQGFYRTVTENIRGTDSTAYPVVFVRSVHETQGITDTIQKWANYIRGLYTEAIAIEEIDRKGEFYRTESDMVQAVGSVFRGLIIFIRILTTSIVRDFILRRFLIAREELVLKSCITREITLDSKL